MKKYKMLSREDGIVKYKFYYQKLEVNHFSGTF